MHKNVISIDLGGTKCAGAAISEDGEILQTCRERISGLKGSAVSKVILTLIDQLRQELLMDRLHGVGISVPGISNQKKGTVWAPNINGWEDYPLKKELMQHLGREVAIHIDSDRACSISGEAWKGMARGYRDAIFLAFGTGIGAGIMVDGNILRGSHDIAGAIGWLALDHHYPEGYHRYGCFEYNASGDGLSRLARDLKDKQQIKTSLSDKKMQAEEIFRAFERKDPLAVATIHAAIEYWAKGVANLVSIFNPEIIIFGGGVFGPGLKFLDKIYERSKRWAQPVAIEQVRLVGGALGNEAQLIGAARLVKNMIE